MKDKNSSLFFMRRLPSFAIMIQNLNVGLYPVLRIFPHLHQSPAMKLIAPLDSIRKSLLESAKVDLRVFDGYAYVEGQPPRIVLAYEYYRHGSPMDVYLDILHELVHLRQLSEGADLWDGRYPYVDRPTEIEGYSIAVREAMRMGLTQEQIIDHLTNPRMSKDDVYRLYANVMTFITSKRKSCKIEEGKPL